MRNTDQQVKIPYKAKQIRSYLLINYKNRLEPICYPSLIILLPVTQTRLSIIKHKTKLTHPYMYMCIPLSLVDLNLERFICKVVAHTF